MRHILRAASLFAALATTLSAQAAAPSTHWNTFTASTNGAALVPGRYAGEIALNGQIAAADARGDLFVVATQRDLSQPCLVTIKYAASSGAVAWRRELCGDRLTWGAALAVDRAGDVVVTGSVSGVLRAVKYSGGNGAVMWDRRAPSASAEAGFGVALTPAGDAVIAAHTAGITTDVKVVKLRAGDGAIAWQLVVDMGFDEQPAGIAVDPAGDVIVVASYSNDRGDGDWLVRKMAGATGEALWQQAYDSGRRDIPTAVAADSAGNAIITGASALAEGGFAARTVKYTAAGQLAWERSEGNGSSGGRAVGVDSRGGIFVAGQVQSAGGAAALATFKYSSDGTRLWSARHAGGEGGSASAKAIALDPAGDVSVTGVATAAGSSGPDFVTVKYLGATGREMWSHAHREAGASPETAGHAVVSAAGATYAVGAAQAGGPLGLRVMKLANALAAATRSEANVQGLWWASPPGSESGWGVNLVQQGSIVFATWFTYDADGQGAWFVMPHGASQGGNRYAGTLYRTRGPSFASARFDPSQVVGTPVGTASFAFTDSDNGTFAYSVDGFTGQKAIARQVFGSPAPVCVAGGPPGAAANYQDLWWGAPAGAESGWGLNIAHQGDVLFLTWFSYAPDGRGMWLVGSRFDKTGNGRYAGVLHRTSGPAFNAARFDPARVTHAAAGTGTLEFTDSGRGTFTYSVDGVAQSKPIVRQVFAEPQTVCR